MIRQIVLKEEGKQNGQDIQHILAKASHCILSKFNIKVVITYFICILDQNGSKIFGSRFSLWYLEIINTFLVHYLQKIQKIITLS